MSRIALGMATVLALAACAQADVITDQTSTSVTETSEAILVVDGRTPVILDYSPTVSDLGALAFVAMHPELRLIAVTLPGTGESYCDEGVAHTRGVLVALGFNEVPVACGPDDPLTGWNAFPTSWRAGSSEMDLPTATPNDTRSAPELLADVIGQSDVPVRILAVAPLTNLALALQNHPELVDGVGDITIMGGAVDVPGNVTRNEVGEWNIWVDPTAAAVVFASGIPVTLVPLDATNHLPTNSAFFSALDGAATRPAATLVRDAIAKNPFWLSGDGFFFWDELAAAVLVDESLVTFEDHRLVVDDDTRENKGWTRDDQSGTVVRVAVIADRRAFEQLFVNTLVGAHVELGYLIASEAEVAYLHDLEQLDRAAATAVDEIITATAATLGLGDSDDAFDAVVIAAVPEVLSGPWTDQVEAMKAMAVPEALADHHWAWVEALEAFFASADAFVTALETEGFEAAMPMFDQVSEACSAMAEAAEIRLVTVAFNC